MPDEQGNLLPGDEGYVAPEEVVTPTEEPVAAPVIEPVTQEKYNLLLAAFNKLCVRVGLDVQYERALRAEAGLL